MDFLEELEYNHGRDEEGREYYEIDTHIDIDDQRKFIRIIPFTMKTNTREIYMVKILERIGDKFSNGLEVPVGVLPGLMSAFVSITQGEF